MPQDNLSYHLKMFNERVRAMNQTNARILTLNAEEARNLHTEIYDLMAKIASLTTASENQSAVQVNMDGGGFK
jgi:hypothetical protein